MFKKLIFFMIFIIVAEVSFIGYKIVTLESNSNSNKQSKTAENKPATGKSAESKPTASNPIENKPTASKPADPVKTPEKEVQPTGKGVDPIKEKIKSMSLSEKIGQMIIVGADGYEIDDHAKQMIEKYHVSGFVLFKQNIKSADQMLGLLHSLKSANTVNKVPLFLSVDEEGGRVSRMPAELVKIPGSGAIGKINNSNFSFDIGSVIAEEIKMFGYNMDFGPVLDINSNPKNPVIGDRSFSSSPGIVSKLGVQTMKGIRSKNVIPVVKHFPGHGDTSVDSHIGLPRVYNDMKRLQSFELIPFAEAIKNGADAVMVAHILLPKIDSAYPASFSKTLITGVLRQSMKFQGVVITDDMTMGAIIKNYNMADAAVKSVNAGSDIVLVCHEFSKETTVIQALTKAAQTGVIPIKRIDESVYRILKLKQKYAITDKSSGMLDIKKVNTKINQVLNKYSSKKK